MEKRRRAAQTDEDDDVCARVEFVRRKSWEEAVTFIQRSTACLRSATTVQRLTLKKGGRLHILGDTHGQHSDFEKILRQCGHPHKDRNVYLLNGDIVDRGVDATTILLLALHYAEADPGSLLMNRGNHEVDYMNRDHGFYRECLTKYGDRGGEEVYTSFQNLFNELPLCTVVDAEETGLRIFVVHGGVPRVPCRLEEIERIPFRVPIPEFPVGREQQIFFDLLWSDPHDEDGLGRNARGPTARCFGPDITAAFMKDNGFDHVVRSHSVPLDGRGFQWHEKHGEKKLLTVFTASNYSLGNAGAVAQVSDAGLQPREI